MIAGAQVMEMQCGYKDQIAAALAKADRLGMPFDLNRKENYSDVVSPRDPKDHAEDPAPMPLLRGARTKRRTSQNL